MPTSFSPISLGGGATGEQMLGAVDLRCLAEHRRAALFDQQVGGVAERRVGGDAGVAVRTAALQRQHQFRHRHRLALHGVGVGEHLLDHLDAALDGLARSARRLDRHGAEHLVLFQVVILDQIGNLHHLAAEADHQRADQVGVLGIAPFGTLHHLEAFRAAAGHAAAGSHDEGHDAVDVGIVVEHAGAVEGVGDETRHRGGAVHAGQDADVVAGADLAVLAAIALEGAPLFERQHMLRGGGLGEVVVAGEVVDAAIVLVDEFARPDRRSGEADDLAELEDGFALGDRPGRHLVALGHARNRDDPLGGRAGQDRIDGNDHVVGGVQPEHARRLGAFRQGGHGHDSGIGGSGHSRTLFLGVWGSDHSLRR